jgi:hypothetical protein
MASESIHERATALVEREAASPVDSTRIVTQLTTGEGSALVVAVETADATYWVVDDDNATACYTPDGYESADAALSEHVETHSR